MLSTPLGQYQTALRASPGFEAPEQTTAAVAAAAAVAADMTDSLDAAAGSLHADAAAAGLALAAACPAAADASTRIDAAGVGEG